MMHGRRLGRLRVGLTTLLLALALAGPALAADDDAKKPFREPGIHYLEEKKPYIPWVIGAAFVAGILFVGFKNPHRSHMD